MPRATIRVRYDASPHPLRRVHFFICLFVRVLFEETRQALAEAKRIFVWLASGIVADHALGAGAGAGAVVAVAVAVAVACCLLFVVAVFFCRGG